MCIQPHVYRGNQYDVLGRYIVYKVVQGAILSVAKVCTCI